VAVTALWYVGTALGGVKLLVSEKDAAQARRLLADDYVNALQTRASPAWKCEKCHSDVDAGFVVCWNCGAELDESTAKEEVQSDSKRIQSQTAPHGADAPLDKSMSDRPPDGPDGKAAAGVESQLPDDLIRAWRASLFGYLLLPPLLNLCSTWLLIRNKFFLGRCRNWRVAATCFANAALFAFVVFLIFLMTRPQPYMIYPDDGPIQVDYDVELPLLPDAD